MGFLEDFVFENFCRPILEFEGYNLINTLVYGAIMLFVAFVIFYPILNKRGIKFDYKFALAILPFVLFGSTFRILEDLKLLSRSCNVFDFSFYTITPGVYILIGLITFATVLITHFISKKTNIAHHKLLAASGLLFAAPFVFFSLQKFTEPIYFGLILVTTAILIIVPYFIAKKFKPQAVSDHLNVLAVAGQTLDGTATFIATQILSCGEQHPVSNAILGIFPFGFVLVKIAIAYVIVYYIDKEVKDPQTRNYLKLIIIVLGFAPGIRDLFTIGVGTCS